MFFKVQCEASVMKKSLFCKVILCVFCLSKVGMLLASPLKQPQHRIVSLSPATTEMLFDLGLGGAIFGTTEYSHFPPEARNILRIGPYQRPHLEMILTLKPTMVVGVREGVDTVSARLKRADIPLLILNTQSLSNFQENMKILGETFGVKDRSMAILKEWQTHWARLPVVQKPIKVVIQVEQNPLMLAGKNTYLDELVNKCGAANLFQETGYQRISREFMATLKPDKILTFTRFGKNSTPDQIIDDWRTYPLLKKTKVEFFDPDSASRLTLRLAKEAKKICLKVIS